MRRVMPTPIDIAMLNKDAPTIVFKKDTPKKPKKVVEEPEAPKKSKPVEVQKMPAMDVINEVVSKPKVKKVEPEPVKKVEPEPVVEEKPKKVKLEKGSELAKQWGLMMKEKRDAKKAIKIKEMNEPLPESM